MLRFQFSGPQLLSFAGWYKNNLWGYHVQRRFSFPYYVLAIVHPVGMRRAIKRLQTNDGWLSRIGSCVLHALRGPAGNGRMMAIEPFKREMVRWFENVPHLKNQYLKQLRIKFIEDNHFMVGKATDSSTEENRILAV